jgi:hypothetical protein
MIASRTRATLVNLANDIAIERESRMLTIQKELLDIEAKKTEKEFALHTTGLTLKRASDYRLILGSDLFCPRCWIDNEARNLMSPKASETNDDIWECSHCGQSVIVPSGG